MCVIEFDAWLSREKQILNQILGINDSVTDMPTIDFFKKINDA